MFITVKTSVQVVFSTPFLFNFSEEYLKCIENYLCIYLKGSLQIFYSTFTFLLLFFFLNLC